MKSAIVLGYLNGAKILLGSKYLNIVKLYILKKDNLIFIMESHPDQECRGSQ